MVCFTTLKKYTRVTNLTRQKNALAMTGKQKAIIGGELSRVQFID